MANKLRKLKIDRVDLTARGANPDADIVFFKGDNQTNMSPYQKLTNKADSLVSAGFATDRHQAINKMASAPEHRDLVNKAWEAEREKSMAYIGARIVKDGDGSKSTASAADLYAEITRHATEILTRGEAKDMPSAINQVCRARPALYSAYTTLAAGA